MDEKGQNNAMKFDLLDRRGTMIGLYNVFVALTIGHGLLSQRTNLGGETKR